MRKVAKPLVWKDGYQKQLSPKVWVKIYFSELYFCTLSDAVMNIMPGDDLYDKNDSWEPISVKEREAQNSERATYLNRTIWDINENQEFQTTWHRTNIKYFDEITKTITPLDYRQIEMLLKSDKF